MDNYKVRWCTLDGEHITDWLSKESAKRNFLRKANEKELKTVWAELLYYDEDETYIIDRFERKVVTIMGHDMVV